MSIRRYFNLILHAIRLARTGQLRFRLETFGAYYPAAQYAAPWWRISPRRALQLVGRVDAYAAWIEEMQAIQRRGRPHRRLGWLPRRPRR